MCFRGGHDKGFPPAWLYKPRSSGSGAFSRRKATLEYAPMGASPIKFGTSGWRGLIADDFTFANVRLAVAAISDHVKSRAKDPVVLVASDPRFYSEEFTRLAVEVLQESGIRVLQADTFAPTPAVAYEIIRRKLAGAINFTASHNPAQYHGLKLSSSDAGPALPEVTKDIEARVAKLVADGGRTPRKKAGSAPRASVETVSLAEPFLKRLGELVRFDVIKNSGAKFVVDPRHGSGVGYLDRILSEHGVNFTPIHTNRDVLFDGVGPDVSEEILAALGGEVREKRATAGLATDGDADRDRKSTRLNSSHLVISYAVFCLKKKKTP